MTEIEAETEREARVYMCLCVLHNKIIWLLIGHGFQPIVHMSLYMHLSDGWATNNMYYYLDYALQVCM